MGNQTFLNFKSLGILASLFYLKEQEDHDIINIQRLARLLEDAGFHQHHL